MERKAFGAELRALRVLRGLSVVAAARRAGVSRVSLHRWEAGEQAPQGQALAALLDGLGATPQERAALVADEPPTRAQPALTGSPLGPSAHPGQMLRALREGRNLSQSRLAGIVGVSQQAVAKWEMGQAMPGDEALGRVAAAFGVEDLGFREGSLDLYDPIVDPYDARMRIRDVRYGPDPRLSIAHLLAIERELWPLAARDVRWEEPLAEALAWRSMDHAVSGEHTLALEAGGRALRLAESSGNWDAVYHGILALSDVRRERGSAPARAVRLWQAYAERVRNPLVRAFALSHLAIQHNGNRDRASTDRAFEQVAPLVQGAERDEVFNDTHPFAPISETMVDLRAIGNALFWGDYDQAWRIFEGRFPGWRACRFGAPGYDWVSFLPIYIDLHRSTGQSLPEGALRQLDALARAARSHDDRRFFNAVGPQLGIYTPALPKPR